MQRSTYYTALISAQGWYHVVPHDDATKLPPVIRPLAAFAARSESTVVVGLLPSDDSNEGLVEARGGFYLHREQFAAHGLNPDASTV